MRTQEAAKYMKMKSAQVFLNISRLCVAIKCFAKFSNLLHAIQDIFRRAAQIICANCNELREVKGILLLR